MALIPEINDVTYSTLLLERLPVSARLMLSGLDGLTVKRVNDLTSYAAEALAFELNAFLNGLQLGEITIKWPVDWWQAVRERWCPAWWLKKHPVIYVSRTVTAYEWADKVKLPDNASSHKIVIMEHYRGRR